MGVINRLDDALKVGLGAAADASKSTRVADQSIKVTEDLLSQDVYRSIPHMERFSETTRKNVGSLVGGENPTNAIGLLSHSQLEAISRNDVALSPARRLQIKNELEAGGFRDMPTVTGSKDSDGTFSLDNSIEHEDYVQYLVDEAREAGTLPDLRVPVVIRNETGAWSEQGMLPRNYVNNLYEPIDGINTPRWSHLEIEGLPRPVEGGNKFMPNLLNSEPNKWTADEATEVVNNLHDLEYISRLAQSPGWWGAEQFLDRDSHSLVSIYRDMAKQDPEQLRKTTAAVRANYSNSAVADRSLWATLGQDALDSATAFTGSAPYSKSTVYNGVADDLADKPYVFWRVDRKVAYDETGELAVWSRPNEIGAHTGPRPVTRAIEEVEKNTTNQDNMRLAVEKTSESIWDMIDASGAELPKGIDREWKIRYVIGKAIKEEGRAGSTGISNIDEASGAIEYGFDNQAFTSAVVQRIADDLDLSFDQISNALDANVVGEIAKAYKHTGDTLRTAFVSKASKPLLLVDYGHWKPEHVIDMVKDMPAFRQYREALLDLKDGQPGAVATTAIERNKILTDIIETVGYDHIVYLNAAEPTPSRAAYSYIMWNKDLMKPIQETVTQERGTHRYGAAVGSPLGLGYGVESQAAGGTIPQTTFDLLMEREGNDKTVQADILHRKNPKKYPDKNYTGGHGHVLTPAELKLYPEGTAVPDWQARDWLLEDTKKAHAAATKQAKQLGITENQEFMDVLTSVNFQLGVGWAKEHTKTWAALKDGRYDDAITEIKTNSKWHTQTPTRTKDFIRVIEGLK